MHPYLPKLYILIYRSCTLLFTNYRTLLFTDYNDLRSLKKGSIIIKYPIDGSTLDSFKGATNENVLIRAIRKIDKEMNEVVLSCLIGKVKLENIYSGLDSLVFSDIKKTLDSLYTEKVWWLLMEDKV